jgi:hypothetical protein
MFKGDDIKILTPAGAIRRRPEMYLGATGPLGARFLARGLFECPLAPRWVGVVMDRAQLQIRAISVPISVTPRSGDERIYLVEVASRLLVPIDDPPSISKLEILDIHAKPPAFCRINTAPTAIAIANALSKEMKIVSYQAGVATQARFRFGELASPITTTESVVAEDGLEIEFALDLDVFTNGLFTDSGSSPKSYGISPSEEASMLSCVMPSRIWCSP